MSYAANRYPVAMKAAQTVETRSLHQVVPSSGLGDLSFDGSGLFGSGLFGGSTWGLPEWGVILGGGLMVAKMFFGGRKGISSGRRKSLQVAKAKYELERAEA